MGRRPTPKSDEEKEAARLARNARRRLARSADPKYRVKATLYQRRFSERNVEGERARRRLWIANNPEQRRVNRQRRRAVERNARGHHTREQIIAITHAQGGRCAYCGVSEGLHLDHVIPLSRGGSNWPWNLQWLCADHNIAKGAKTDSEYRREIGLPVIIWESLRLWAAALMLDPQVLVPEAEI